MPTNHRGQEVSDNHFNTVKFGTWESAKGVNPRYTTTAISGESKYSGNIVNNGYAWSASARDTTNSKTDGHGKLLGVADYKTPHRAKVAAQGMIKRHAEGRDMQTGRSGYQSSNPNSAINWYDQPVKGDD